MTNIFFCSLLEASIIVSVAILLLLIFPDTIFSQLSHDLLDDFGLPPVDSLPGRYSLFWYPAP